jgi:RNA-directed DNA polymerase
LEPDHVSTKQERIAALARANPQMALTSLNHHLDYGWLLRAYELTRKDGAVGVDGQTAAAYAANLESNLRDLLERLKSGRYRAPPVRRQYIPKTDGSQRPLGIPTFEDKVAQRAIVMLLEPIYEQDFRPCSFGFRPGRSAHQALQSLRKQVTDRAGYWVLDVDLRKYFDTIDHGHLRALLARRVVDGVVRKLIDKLLAAGVLESGQLSYAATGTPQGGVISPLLANVFLHYVLDEWFVEEVCPRLAGRAGLTRYADDFVITCAHRGDAERLWAVLPKRMARFGLQVHEGKSRLVDFRPQPSERTEPPELPTSFQFLGFTHVWATSRHGWRVVVQRTAKDRLARAVKALHDGCARMLHEPLPQQWQRLCRRLKGHYAYFGITGNSRALKRLHNQAERTWHYWLSRRSRGRTLPWDRFRALLQRFPLPPPRIVHRYASPHANP